MLPIGRAGDYFCLTDKTGLTSSLKFNFTVCTQHGQNVSKV